MRYAKFAIEAILPDNGIKTMADKGIRITFDTQEPTEEQFREVFRMKGKHGKLVFAAPEAEIVQDDIDLKDYEPLTKGSKSPSQILRNRMYVYYTSTKGSVGFKQWYEDTLDEIGKKYLDKVNTEE